MKDTLCIGGRHSHHQFGVNLVGFHAIIFTVYEHHSESTMNFNSSDMCFQPVSTSHHFGVVDNVGYFCLKKMPEIIVKPFSYTLMIAQDLGYYAIFRSYTNS